MGGRAAGKWRGSRGCEWHTISCAPSRTSSSSERREEDRRGSAMTEALERLSGFIPKQGTLSLKKTRMCCLPVPCPRLHLKNAFFLTFAKITSLVGDSRGEPPKKKSSSEVVAFVVVSRKTDFVRARLSTK